MRNGRIATAGAAHGNVVCSWRSGAAAAVAYACTAAKQERAERQRRHHHPEFTFASLVSSKYQTKHGQAKRDRAQAPEIVVNASHCSGLSCDRHGDGRSPSLSRGDHGGGKAASREGRQSCAGECHLVLKRPE